MKQQSKKVKTVYISNLNYKIGEKDLTGIFSKFGHVADVMVMMKPGGKHRMGIAFVRMSKHESALKAVEALNGKLIDGRTVKAKMAQEDQAPKHKHIEKASPSKEKEEEATPRRKRKGEDFKKFLNSLKK